MGWITDCSINAAMIDTLGMECGTRIVPPDVLVPNVARCHCFGSLDLGFVFDTLMSLGRRVLLGM